jgi:ABC-type transport system involved in cytochrome c biogenesis permease subunit
LPEKLFSATIINSSLELNQFLEKEDAMSRFDVFIVAIGVLFLGFGLGLMVGTFFKAQYPNLLIGFFSIVIGAVLLGALWEVKSYEKYISSPQKPSVSEHRTF